MSVKLGQRTEETVAVYFERAQSAAIRAVLPQRARTLEEALADYRRTLEPGASSFGRTILADGQYVGDVWCYGIRPDSAPAAMVSYCVFEPSLRGRGAASQALGRFLPEVAGKYGLKTVGAFTFADNLPSLRVLEKNGFRLTESFTEGGRASGYYLRSSMENP